MHAWFGVEAAVWRFGALPVTQPDHPDSLHGLNYFMPNPGRRRYR
jgi:hypothetical protein